MFKIITRVRYPDLYERLKASALAKSVMPISFESEEDKDGLPHIAATYNRLGSKKADYLIFCHDDVVFLEDAWDEKLLQEFRSTGADILGVVGRDAFGIKSNGGKHCFGKYAGGQNDELDSVKILSGKCQDKKVDVVDGMFMAVRWSFFKNNKFDETFDELWLYADDFCLSGKTYISNILIAHHKPDKYYGKYPKGMKPLTDYLPAMKDKWGRSDVKEMSLNEQCAIGPLSGYLELGQDRVYEWLTDKYKEIHA